MAIPAPGAVPLSDLLQFEPAVRRQLQAAELALGDFKSCVFRAHELAAQLTTSLSTAADCLTQLREVMYDGLHSHLSTPASPATAAGPTTGAPQKKALEALEEAGGKLQTLAASLQALVQQPLEAAQQQLAQQLNERREQLGAHERQLCESLHHFAEFRPKKDSDKARFETNMAVYNARKNWHHAMLEYVVDLNTLMAQRKSVSP